MARYLISRRSVPALLLCLTLLSNSSPARDNDAKWLRINSAHFSVLTDAGEKKGREVAVAFEQMRMVFGQLLARTRVSLPEPLEIIALRNDQEYAVIAPMVQGHPTSAAGFFLAGEDRNYVVLNLLEPESWRAVSHEFAHMMLNYNYPPTQSWFDEGFAEYFSSIRIGEKQIQIGGDPELVNPAEASTSSGSLADLLHGPAWLPLTELFATKHDAAIHPEGSHHTQFQAESWMVMHYLLNKDKLSETGIYFDSVQNQRMPVEQAIQQAYGMSAAQLEQAVKEYFHSIAGPLEARPATDKAGSQVYQIPLPAEPDNVGTSRADVSDTEGPALVAEAAARVPEHREQAARQLDALIAQPKGDSAVAHRTLAWIHMVAGEYDEATEELARALELDVQDPWVHYYLALVKYHAAQASGQLFHGLANMMQDLRVVLDWNPEFAEAYSMLSMARVEGGGVNSAMESMRAAIRLSPRNEQYQLNMAHIYMAGKQWDAALRLLEGLVNSQNPTISQASKQDMLDLPTLKKYGMLPQRSVPPPVSGPASSIPARQIPLPKPAAAGAKAAEERASREAASNESDEKNENDENESDETRQQPAETAPDRRPLKFAKGKLLSVDCSQAPGATLSVVVAGKSMKLRTADYKSLQLVGEDTFSCDWKNRAVAVNYKAGGRADGDLVSLELQ